MSALTATSLTEYSTRAVYFMHTRCVSAVSSAPLLHTRVVHIAMMTIVLHAYRAPRVQNLRVMKCCVKQMLQPERFAHRNAFLTGTFECMAHFCVERLWIAARFAHSIATSHPLTVQVAKNRLMDFDRRTCFIVYKWCARGLFNHHVVPNLNRLRYHLFCAALCASKSNGTICVRVKSELDCIRAGPSFKSLVPMLPFHNSGNVSN